MFNIGYREQTCFCKMSKMRHMNLILQSIQLTYLVLFDRFCYVCLGFRQHNPNIVNNIQPISNFRFVDATKAIGIKQRLSQSNEEISLINCMEGRQANLPKYKVWFGK